MEKIMPRHESIALSGIVRHVFAHRFTLEADDEIHLADLGPKGAEAFPLRRDLRVTIEGERRPSEIKVSRIAADGLAPVEIHHKKPHHGPAHHDSAGPADPERALAALSRSGWTPAGEPRRKPKHFEVLARREGGTWTELHVDFNGSIYKEKAPDAAKWGSAVA
jgi:hypothetical protein